MPEKAPFKEVFKAWEAVLDTWLNSIPASDRAAYERGVEAFRKTEIDLLARHGWDPAEFRDAIKEAPR